MKLVWKKHHDPTKVGELVSVGDIVRTGHRNLVRVDYFRPPHKPSSEGKITIQHGTTGPTQEVYCSVIGAEWIEREDRGESIVDDTAMKVGPSWQNGDPTYKIDLGSLEDGRLTALIHNGLGEAFEVDIIIRDKNIVIEAEDLNRGLECVFFKAKDNTNAIIHLP